MVNLPDKRPCVYKFYDVSGQLIYVGSTSRPAVRRRMHRKNSRWFSEVVKGELIWCDTLEDARELELELIGEEKPKYNKQGKRGDGTRKWEREWSGGAYHPDADTYTKHYARRKRIGRRPQLPNYMID